MWMQKKKKGSGRDAAPVPRYVKGHSRDVDKYDNNLFSCICSHVEIDRSFLVCLLKIKV